MSERKSGSAGMACRNSALQPRHLLRNPSGAPLALLSSRLVGAVVNLAMELEVKAVDLDELLEVVMSIGVTHDGGDDEAEEAITTTGMATMAVVMEVEVMTTRALEVNVVVVLAGLAIAVVLVFAVTGHLIGGWTGLWRRLTPNPFLAEIAGQAFRFVAIVVGLVVAGILSGIVGWAIARICVRLKADYLAMASIGIAEIIRLAVINEATSVEDINIEGHDGFIATGDDLTLGTNLCEIGIQFDDDFIEWSVSFAQKPFPDPCEVAKELTRQSIVNSR